MVPRVAAGPPRIVIGARGGQPGTRPPAAPPLHPPLPKAKPQEATRAADRPDTGQDKPEPPTVTAAVPEAKRPDRISVPAAPIAPPPIPKAPAPALPTSARPPLPRPQAPAPAPPVAPRPRQIEHAAPAAVRPQLPATPPPLRTPPGRPVTLPGAPQPQRPQKRVIRPAVPVRSVRPGGPRLGGAPGGVGRPAAAPARSAKVLVPGKPIVQRPVRTTQIPGIPTQAPGHPAYGAGRPPAGMRPGMPGRVPGGGPGRPPGGGPGRPPGQRRPRPPQQRRRDLEAQAENRIQRRKPKAEPPKAANSEIFASEGTTIKELAEKLGLKANEIIKSLYEQGEFLNINQPLELERIKKIAAHFGATATELTFEEEVILGLEEEEDAVENLEARPPVVTIMGHVDHGKTSLLDAIRSTNVAAREAGGITQAIGAYHVEHDGKRIVFIDTPGHEAFTKMRAHGASVTDIVVLVVAADDGVMPQTLEAISHAKEAKVPIVVAVNKIDVPKADPERVKQQLADRGLIPVDWGGDAEYCPVSAKTHEGIGSLLLTISLVADLAELKANPARSAVGVVLEAKRDRGMGPVATVLTQNGTLRVGDTFVVGSVPGKVRALMDDHGKRVKEAGPSSAVVVLGLDDLPEPGDQLSVADAERVKQISDYRARTEREKAMAQTGRLSLEQFQERLKEGRAKELSIIVKSDFQGSATVLGDTLAKLKSDKVKVRVIHSGVGAVKESDVTLAIASAAIIIGFNVRPERSAAALAEKEGIDIRLHTVIYELVDELKKALAGLLEPIRKEEFLGRARVLEVFNITNVGTVAGCMLDEGVATSNASARLLRDHVVVHSGKLASLRRFKEDVREVRAGQECGMHFERYNDVKKSDEIELFKTVEIAQDINELIPV